MTLLGPLLSIIGLIVEAIGVVIFTADVLRASRELVDELSTLDAKVRTMHLRTDMITISDGPFRGVDLGRVEVREPPPDPSRRLAAIRNRRQLVVGAVLVAAGLVLQLAGTLLGVPPEYVAWAKGLFLRS